MLNEIHFVYARFSEYFIYLCELSLASAIYVCLCVHTCACLTSGCNRLSLVSSLCELCEGEYHFIGACICVVFLCV